MTVTQRADKAWNMPPLTPRLRVPVRSWKSAAAVLAGVAALVGAIIRWPLPWGIAIQALEVGMLVALLATGLALIYRANRVINFAQADLGSIPLALSMSLVVFSGWPAPLGFIVGLVVAVVVGVSVEFLFIRRFRKAPRLLLTIATIGITVLLALGGILLPRWWGRNLANERLPQLFHWTWDVGSRRLHANDLVALVAAPLLMLAIAWFLQRTSIGTAIRAVAERSDRASMLGIPVGRVSSVVWAVAAALSFSALFLRAGILGAPFGPAFAITNLLYALAALVIAKLERLPRVALAGVAVGFVDRWVNWHTSANVAIPIVAAVLMAAMLLQRSSTARRDLDVGSSWRGADEVRPLAPAVRRLWELRAARVLAFAAIAAVIALVPAVLRIDRVIRSTEILIWVVIGLSLMVLTGWAGQVSLGQAGLVAIGAAVSGACTSRWNVDLTLSLVIAAVVCGIAALAIGLPALRLRGLYLAVTTLAFGLVVSSWLLNTQFFGWMPKRRFTRPALFGVIDVEDEGRYFLYCLAIVVVVVLALRGIRHSRTGRIIIAQRENPRAAQSFSVPRVEGTLRAFILSGMVAGVAGGLYAHLNRAFNVNSSQYTPGASFGALTSAIIGGLGSITGVVTGAVYSGVTRMLPSTWGVLASGLGVLAVLMMLPSGIGSQWFRLRDLIARWALARRSREETE